MNKNFKKIFSLVTAKVRVYCCLEAENSDLGVALVSRPTRVL